MTPHKLPPGQCIWFQQDTVMRELSTAITRPKVQQQKCGKSLLQGVWRCSSHELHGLCLDRQMEQPLLNCPHTLSCFMLYHFLLFYLCHLSVVHKKQAFTGGLSIITQTSLLLHAFDGLFFNLCIFHIIMNKCPNILNITFRFICNAAKVECDEKKICQHTTFGDCPPDLNHVPSKLMLFI